MTLAVERTLDEALKRDQLVEVDYVTKRGAYTRSVIEPLSIVHDYAHNTHRLYARCLEHNRIEPRDIKRIKQARAVDVVVRETKRVRNRK